MAVRVSDVGAAGAWGVGTARLVTTGAALVLLLRTAGAGFARLFPDNRLNSCALARCFATSTGGGGSGVPCSSSGVHSTLTSGTLATWKAGWAHTSDVEKVTS